MRKIFALALLAFLAGCGRQPANQTSDNNPSSPASTPASSAAGSPAAAPGAPAGSTASSAATKPSAVPETLPAGTVITVKLSNAVGSKISQTGDRFNATVAEPVTVNGKVAIPTGAPAEGVVSEAAPLGRFKGGALLRLRLESAGGFPVQATLTRSEKGKGKRSAVMIGGGAGLGALIGGLAGGGKGAAIGAAAGAGAGTGGAAFTGNKEITLPAEAAIAFKLAQPATKK